LQVRLKQRKPLGWSPAPNLLEDSQVCGVLPALPLADEIWIHSASLLKV